MTFVKSSAQKHEQEDISSLWIRKEEKSELKVSRFNSFKANTVTTCLRRLRTSDSPTKEFPGPSTKD